MAKVIQILTVHHALPALQIQADTFITSSIKEGKTMNNKKRNPSALNFVAKHDFNRASFHPDRKRENKESKRTFKHKGNGYE